MDGREATFSRVQAVAEGDDAHPSWLENPVNLRKHLLRLLQVLCTDTAEHSVE